MAAAKTPDAPEKTPRRLSNDLFDAHNFDIAIDLDVPMSGKMLPHYSICMKYLCLKYFSRKLPNLSEANFNNLLCECYRFLKIAN